MAQSTGFLLRTYMNMHLELNVPFKQSLVSYPAALSLS